MGYFKYLRQMSRHGEGLMSGSAMPAVEMVEEPPIITVLGVVEGEILEYLEAHGATALYRLIQAQDWPASMVMMAVGALIRQGLVGGGEHRLELMAGAAPMRASRD